MIEYNEFRRKKFEYYRQKYSIYVPFKKILRKIDKGWQIYQYHHSPIESYKKKNHTKKVTWKSNIEDVKFYNRNI